MDSKRSASKTHRVIQFTNPRSIDDQTYYIDIDSNVDPDPKYPQSYTDRLLQFATTVGVRVQDYDQEWQQHLFRTFHWISQVNEDITQRQLEKCGTLDFYRGKYHSQLTVRPSREDDDMDKFTMIIKTEHDEGEDGEARTSRGRPFRRSWDDQGFTQAQDATFDLDHRYHQVITGVQNTDFPDGSHELQISYGHTQDHEPPRHEPSINDLLVQSIRNQSPYWVKLFEK
ncbi:hypothetical protein V865_007245 [Kwoniella europaea PYCC6329]|uniref:Uncharacterized protein n=1 Tax=Kwoniella europaea PYCC6329 TaxID=1423913 RepID=A0AAX4KTN8_9TREE